MSKIKEIPVLDRPIERLINIGPSFLSNEELLAIILRTGSKNMSSKELALSLLKNFENIKDLKNIDYSYLIKKEGIGKTKAASILSVIELAKRINTEVDNINNIKITSSDIVFNYYKNKFETKKQEYFYCIYLDQAKKVIKEKLLYIGTINASLVHPREVFKEAYIVSATSIICVHNHPSGNTIPSKQDIELTSNLKKLGIIHGIEILDHIIIGGNSYYSFYENNRI